jgi:rhodanese-related sulfurtransferase
MKHKVLLWLAVAVLVAVVGFMLFKPSTQSGISNVDAVQAEKVIDAGAQIIDVRTAGEFQMGHIPGAVNAPVDTLETEAASWDKTKTYVVYCATGSRSATAVEIMKGLGFKNIAHLSAGIQAWPGKLDTGAQTSNQSIETSGKPVFVEFYTDS